MPSRGQRVRIIWVLCSLLIAQLALPPGLVLTRCTKTGALSWRPAKVCVCPLQAAAKSCGGSSCRETVAGRASAAEIPCAGPVDGADGGGSKDCEEIEEACACCAQALPEPSDAESQPTGSPETCVHGAKETCGCCVDLFVCEVEAQQAPVDTIGALARSLGPPSERIAIPAVPSQAAPSLPEARTRAAITPPRTTRPLLI